MASFLTIVVTSLFGASVEDVRKRFESAVGGVESVDMPLRFVNNQWQLPNYAFVTFQDEFYVNLALSMVPPVFSDRQVTIRLCKMYENVPDTLRVTNLPAGTTEAKVKAMFEEYKPQKVKLVKDGALVSFTESKDRNVAVVEMNGRVVSGSAIKVEFSNESI